MPNRRALFASILLALPLPVAAQPPQQPAIPQFVSPELLEGNRVAFRIHAPKASEVRLIGTDIPGNQKGAELKKAENGVWEVVLGPIEPGSYRYFFLVDGVAVIDPRNPSTSESNNNSWSLFHIPGHAFMDTADVPHGAVAEVTYYSTVLKRFRRMHVYTPPGYEQGGGRYPVFYLLHGGGDSDDSWSTVGRAGFILDNLIAAKKAKPMIVVMPAGHTSRAPRTPGVLTKDEFPQEFMTDILPYIEKHYRVIADRAHRALAGLSMGGAQTLNIAFANPNHFGYVGVYSSGIFGIVPRPNMPQPQGPSWEEQHKAALSDAKARQGLKLFWFRTGKEDFLLETSRATVELFRKYGFQVDWQETPGAHTWIVWRQYLNEFAPLLF
ncbi:MAG: alpha/beta hydrolase-fold protein [Bryobacteraceae bacterium]|nr:alpha/beta hydrolase-fold protein [Bryobacteraceae bacterium]